IPVGYGLVILLWSSAALAVLTRALPGHRSETAAYFAVVVGFGGLGFLDDWFGDRSATGIRGHIRALTRGKVTTGLVKAVGGLALGLLVARFVQRQSWPDAVLNGLVIALAANSVNLLDLRPGRACAAF